MKRASKHDVKNQSSLEAFFRGIFLSLGDRSRVVGQRFRSSHGTICQVINTGGTQIRVTPKEAKTPRTLAQARHFQYWRSNTRWYRKPKRADVTAVSVESSSTGVIGGFAAPVLGMLALCFVLTLPGCEAESKVEGAKADLSRHIDDAGPVTHEVTDFEGK